MRTALLSTLLVVFGFSSHAQLRLLPMIGFENSMVCLKYNDQKVKSALDVTSPQMSLRLDYAFKKGHGPYIGINTSRSAIEYSFKDPATGMNVFNTSNTDYRISMSGGYGFTTKPIFFNKPSSNTSKMQLSNTSKAMMNKDVQQKEVVVIKKSCGSSKEIKTIYSSRSNCGSKYKKPSEKVIEEVRVSKIPQKKNDGWFMQIQPSAGLTFVPGGSNAIETEMQNGASIYKYRAGDFNTALVTGANFIFGKNRDQKFVVNLNYFTGLGNLGTQSLVVEEGGKTTTTDLRSSISGWSMSLGLPIQFGKRNAPRMKVIEEKTIYKKQYERSYKTGCSKKS